MYSASDIREEIVARISHLIPFFYPSSQDTPPDPAATVARISHALQAHLIDPYSVSTYLPAFLLHFASIRPGHTDHILHTIKLLLEEPSLPPIDGCDWDTSRPNVPFSEMFDIVFVDDLNNPVRGPLDASDPDSYFAGSLVCSRARSLGMLDTPEIVNSLAEGLKFPPPIHFSVFGYQGESAEIALVGSCLQLLGGAASAMKDRPWVFTKERILACLDSAQSSQNENLIQFARSHIQKDPITDLTSMEIVDGLKSVGWRFPSAPV